MNDDVTMTLCNTCSAIVFSDYNTEPPGVKNKGKEVHGN